eukprot:6174521-Pleurochrysis_carterae.AAC.12
MYLFDPRTPYDSRISQLCWRAPFQCSHAHLPILQSHRMRPCGPLVRRSTSTGFTACAWPPPPASTTDVEPCCKSFQFQCPRLRPFPDRDYRYYVIKTISPPRFWMVALGKSEVNNIYELYAK